mmetsp:Transcript_5726/g.10206  ORF Transcript_5726/g.10206 Transcript_5726/m.10206 type:complete len:703 (-) Transcript_5726:87-2195(-)
MTQKTTLPLLAGAKSLVTGTYIAEQRSKGFYDIVSTSTPTGEVQKSLQGRQKKRGIRRAEPTKCTMLPALSSIDPLLGEDVFLSEFEKDLRTMPTEQPESRERATSAKPSSARFGGRHTFQTDARTPGEIEEDEQFEELVRHTQPNFRRSGAPASRQAGSASRKKKAKIAECFLFLLRSTFEAPSNTKEHVYHSVITTLGIDHSAAEWRVDAAIKRPFSLLTTFESKKEAFRKMEALMDLGLNVRISNTGTLDEGVAAGQGMKKDYMDTFNSIKVGRKSSHKLPPVLPGGRTLGGFCWRNRRGAVNVLPADAVNHYFETELQLEQQRAEDEENGEAAAAGESGDPAAQEEQPSDGKKGMLKGLVKKHRCTLKSGHVGRRSKAGLANGLTGFFGEEKGDSPANGNAEQKKDGTWDKLLDAICPSQQKISQDRKEACQMLRFFVYGKVGNETALSARDRDRIYYESIGSKQEVFQLFGMWRKLDDDNSGRVDIGEFRAFAESYMTQMMAMGDSENGNSPHMEDSQFRMQGTAEENMKFISKLCDKLAQLLLGKKSSFVIEDMMRLIWPCSQISDIKQMKQWCKELASQAQQQRVKTPPVLSAAECEGLASVFRHFDDDDSGSVSIEELIGKGLIYEDQVDSYLLDWDRNGDGVLSLTEFLEMMCPSGYRATQESTVGTLPTGQRIFLDGRTGLWREEGDPYQAV